MDEAMRACLASCNRVADDELNACLKDASCDDVEDCFPPDPTRHCAAACAILASCGVDDDLTLENCSCFRYSPEAMACIGATDCAGVQDCIEAAPRESACIAAATKLGECNELDQAVGASWVRSCAVDWKEGLTDCIAASPCDVLVARCLPSPLPANCYGSCRRLARCEALGEISTEACAADCEANAWTEERRRCIKTTLCDELPGACPEVAP